MALIRLILLMHAATALHAVGVRTVPDPRAQDGARTGDPRALQDGGAAAEPPGRAGAPVAEKGGKGGKLEPNVVSRGPSSGRPRRSRDPHTPSSPHPPRQTQWTMPKTPPHSVDPLVYTIVPVIGGVLALGVMSALCS